MSGNTVNPAYKDAKVLVFSDFDGTITTQDSNDYMTDNLGYGQAERRRLNIEVLENKMTFRDAFKNMLDSVHTPFDECIEILKKNIKLDPGFKPFHAYCKANGIPIVVVSSGMRPVIAALLENLLGPDGKDIEIVSNDVKISEDKKSWEIVYHDDSHFGHDKSLAILPYRKELPDRERPQLVYCGDGVSDLSAAQHADVLFAKTGHDLVTYCQREKIRFVEFQSFDQITKDVKDIAEGKVKAVALGN